MNYTDINQYIKDHHEFFSEPIVKKFLSLESNKDLLKLAVIDGDPLAQQNLDYAFKTFFYRYRLMSYISTLSHVFSIDYDKKIRKSQTNYQLILDKNPSESSGERLIDKIPAPDLSYKTHYSGSESIEDIIEDDKLLEGLKTLTRKQLDIINLVYIRGLKQKDIAIALNETPQNIGKIKKTALNKLRLFLNEKDGISEQATFNR